MTKVSQPSRAAQVDPIADATLKLLENLRREVNGALFSPGVVAAMTDLDNAGYSPDFALDIRLCGGDPHEIERKVETIRTFDARLIFTTRDAVFLRALHI